MPDPVNAVEPDGGLNFSSFGALKHPNRYSNVGQCADMGAMGTTRKLADREYENFSMTFFIPILLRVSRYLMNSMAPVGTLGMEKPLWSGLSLWRFAHISNPLVHEYHLYSMVAKEIAKNLTTGSIPEAPIHAPHRRLRSHLQPASLEPHFHGPASMDAESSWI